MINRRLVLGWIGLAFAARGAQPGDATTEIKRLIADYVRSINGADTKLASKVWSTSPDVSLIHPLGHEHGWEQVKRNFYEQGMGTLSKRRLSVRDITVRVFGDSAVAEFYWHFEGTIRSDGSAVTTDGRETQVYRRLDPNRWVLIHVHYSGMPAQ